MLVEVLGTGDAFSMNRYNTSFIVEQDQFCVAIDCPHPFLKILKEKSGFKPEDINDIIITHLHGDHISGLDTFLFYKRFVENKVVNVYFTCHNELWKCLKYSMGHLFNIEMESEYFYNAKNLPLNIGPFKVEIMPTYHYVPGSALLIKGENIVGFSGDTGFKPNLIEWLCQADLIFHEVGPPPAHTPYDLLLYKLKEMNAKHKTRLVHYSDSFLTKKSNISVAFSGSSYIVGKF